MWQMLNHLLFAAEGKEFVTPTTAVLTEARLKPVLTAQVRDKLTGESWCEVWRTDVVNLP